MTKTINDPPFVDIEKLLEYRRSKKGNTMFRVKPEAIEELRAVDIIFGADRERDNMPFIAYGRTKFQEILDSGNSQELKVIRIAVNQSSDQLELLIAMVQLAKGSDDYQSDVAADEISELKRMFEL